MKAKHFHPSLHGRQGFTMMEILVVISIMALLAGIVAATAVSMNRAALKGKTKAQIGYLEAGLEDYHREYGEYPEAASSSRGTFGNAQYETGGAKMLYQALTGDGSNEIKGVGGGGSTGDLGSTGEVFLGDLNEGNKSQGMVKRGESGSEYMLVDPFGNPYQYEVYDEENPEKVRNKGSYDLWSFGEKQAEPGYNPEDHPNTWIGNW